MKPGEGSEKWAIGLPKGNKGNKNGQGQGQGQKPGSGQGKSKVNVLKAGSGKMPGDGNGNQKGSGNSHAKGNNHGKGMSPVGTGPKTGGDPVNKGNTRKTLSDSPENKGPIMVGKLMPGTGVKPGTEMGEFKEAVEAARSESSKAINKEKIPRYVKDIVKKYFGGLGGSGGTKDDGESNSKDGEEE